MLAQHKELDDCLVLLEQELKFAQVLSSLNNKRKPMYVIKISFIILNHFQVNIVLL